MLNAAEIRSKHGTFKVRLRGYDPDEVRVYLARFALVAEAVAGPADEETELPSDLMPPNLGNKEFEEIWRGLDRKQVREYLDQLSKDLQAVLPPSL